MGLPQVDEQFLAKCLGFKEWPKHVLIQNDDQCMAARVITDAFRPSSLSRDGELDPSISLSNATSWIAVARRKGLDEGIALERKAWERKILKMFAIREQI